MSHKQLNENYLEFSDDSETVNTNQLILYIL